MTTVGRWPRAQTAVAAAFVLLLGGLSTARAQERASDLEERAGGLRTLHVPSSMPDSLALQSALREKAWDRAEALLVSEADRRPRDTQVLVLAGRVFFLNGKPLNAAIALKKADAIKALDAEERLLLALSYIAMQQGDWARPELDRLAASDPGNVTYTYWLGRLDYDKGQYEAAVSRFQTVTAREPNHVRAWDNLALCYEALNRVDEAVHAYEIAVAANQRAPSPSPWPPLNLAVLLRHAGELTRPEALLREAVGYDETLARAHYELGVVLEQRGEMAAAITSLQRAAAANATYAEPYYALARIFRRQGQKSDADAALATFERLKDRRTSGQP